MSKKILKINDPIHGFILFPDFITKIVDSKEIQRLIRIRQLSGTNHVFPGANHTRFEHSLGVAALAQRLATNLKELHGVNLNQDDINDCIVAALIHDVGHGPFSHNFESILLKNSNRDHEDFTEWIINDSELGDILSDLGFNPKYLGLIATGRIFGQGDTKGSILSQIITSAINVDSMDYLLRDNYHCGTQGRPVDINRLLISMDVINDSILGINIRALIALEGFLLSRISSFRTIYFHKTCRAVQLMLAEGMQILVDEEDILNYKNPDDYTNWDDYIMWARMMKNTHSQKIMKKLQKRQLLKMCYESQIKMNIQKFNPKEIKEELVEQSRIPANQIYIDVPSSPNVPYNHINETRPNEFYTFENNGHNKKMVKLEDHSLFFHHFKGRLKFIRVYTWPKNRKKLAKFSKKLIEPKLNP